MIDDPAFFHTAHAIILSGPRPLYACACGQLVCDHLRRPTRGGSAWLTVPLGAFGPLGWLERFMAFCIAAFRARVMERRDRSGSESRPRNSLRERLPRGGEDPEPSKAAVTVVSELGPFRYVLI